MQVSNGQQNHGPCEVGPSPAGVSDKLVLQGREVRCKGRRVGGKVRCIGRGMLFCQLLLSCLQWQRMHLKAAPGLSELKMKQP